MELSESDVSRVSSLLCSLPNADQTLEGSAMTRLSLYENRPGFYSCLIGIITSEDPLYHADVRRSASSYLKNIIERYWGNSLNKEKTYLRNKLLSHLREENDEIAEMLASIISEIARIDYPQEWPELFSNLAEQLKVAAADILTSHRIFLVLHRTIRKISATKLAVCPRTFAEISSHLFGYCWLLWKSDVFTILDNFSSTQFFAKNIVVEQQDLHLTCERWLLCSSIIGELIILESPGDGKYLKVPPVKEVCRGLLNAVRSFDLFYSKSRDHPNLLFIGKASIILMNILVKIQHRHPNSFGDKSVLQPILKFCLDKIMNAEDEITTSEQFLIQCMLMVKSVLKFIGCKSSFMAPTVSTNGLVKINISNVVASLLPSDRVKRLCKILITRYFLLTKHDLDEWSDNPEGFYYKQQMLQRTLEKLRPCAEALYIVLFNNYENLLGPFVISMLHDATNDRPAKETEEPEMLLREAAYTAVGHVYFELFGKLNFNKLFKRVLDPELCNGDSRLRIIHRKIAFILQEWASKAEGDMRTRVFEALIKLLTYKDLAVRLAACRSLEFLVYEIDFEEEGLLDLLPSCWDKCIELFEDVKEIQSKDQVLDTILLMIERIGKIIPFANKLVDVFQKSIQCCKEFPDTSRCHSNE